MKRCMQADLAQGTKVVKGLGLKVTTTEASWASWRLTAGLYHDPLLSLTLAGQKAGATIRVTQEQTWDRFLLVDEVLPAAEEETTFSIGQKQEAATVPNPQGAEKPLLHVLVSSARAWGVGRLGQMKGACVGREILQSGKSTVCVRSG